MKTQIDLEPTQDKSIRRDFRNVYERFDDRFEEQRTYMDSGFRKIDKRFERVDERFDGMDAHFGDMDARLDDIDNVRFYNMDARLDDMDTRFDDMDTRFYDMDARFDDMDGRLDDMDGRFDDMSGRFDDMSGRFQQMEAIMINSKANSSWHDIAPVTLLAPHAKPGSRYQLPPNFPTKVLKFWHLQRPRNQHTLVSLLHFYDIRHLPKNPIVTSDDSDDSDFEGPSDYLEEAVRQQPAMALSRLAARLGLDYETISRNMMVWEYLRKIEAQKTTRKGKREISSEEEKFLGNDGRSIKRAALSPPLHRGTLAGIPLSDLLRNQEDVWNIEPPEPSEQKAIRTPAPWSRDLASIEASAGSKNEKNRDFRK